MKTAPIPEEVLEANKHDPLALINFLKSRRTTVVPERPDEWIEDRGTNGRIVRIRRGNGGDCTCWGTGWRNGQFMCGQHIPKMPLEYYV
jgi:hypothetical protein